LPGSWLSEIPITIFDIAPRKYQAHSGFMYSLRRFLKDEEGQDLIEYTLLMAFIALASAAIFTSAGGSISGIWGTASNQLSAANTSAS
jgi:Flp pilus assembly pilin Flp